MRAAVCVPQRHPWGGASSPSRFPRETRRLLASGLQTSTTPLSFGRQVFSCFWLQVISCSVLSGDRGYRVICVTRKRAYFRLYSR